MACEQDPQPHHQFTAAYIDNIIIYSPTWEDHLQHLKAVLKALQDTGLIANSTECRLAVTEVTYSGYCAVDRLMKPVVGKVQALTVCPISQTKRQVRHFLT